MCAVFLGVRLLVRVSFSSHKGDELEHLICVNLHDRWHETQRNDGSETYF